MSADQKLAVFVPERAKQILGLKPQIGHNIGLQAPISMR